MRAWMLVFLLVACGGDASTFDPGGAGGSGGMGGAGATVGKLGVTTSGNGGAGGVVAANGGQGGGCVFAQCPATGGAGGRRWYADLPSPEPWQPCPNATFYVDGGDHVTGGSDVPTWSPACLHVKRGTAVTFNLGTSHVLSPSKTRTDPGNPIRSDSVGDYVATFDVVGTFGYYCTQHGNDDGTAMAGAIWVTD